MADWLKQVQAFLWENKEGAIIGGIIGFVAGKWFLKSFGIDMSIFQEQGIIDTAISASKGTLEFAQQKAVWALTALGVFVGILGDMMLKEGWLKKVFK